MALAVCLASVRLGLASWAWISCSVGAGVRAVSASRHCDHRRPALGSNHRAQCRQNPCENPAKWPLSKKRGRVDGRSGRRDSQSKPASHADSITNTTTLIQARRAVAPIRTIPAEATTSPETPTGRRPEDLLRQSSTQRGVQQQPDKRRLSVSGGGECGQVALIPLKGATDSLAPSHGVNTASTVAALCFLLSFDALGARQTIVLQKCSVATMGQG